MTLLAGTDDDDYPASLNRGAVVALVGATIVAVVGLFALPTLRSAGLTFREAFAIVGVAEFGAAVVAGVAAYHLYSEPAARNERS